ncbi:MAG: aldo/keto reductase [Ignavibacteria bacterium]|nr:aldo/keto reductase [Ignavibacteria bacterium]
MKPADIGFGCYRIDYRVEEHYKSLYKAILGGIALIDTSANYSDGGSEILVGNVITDLINENKITRKDVIIVTKAGYIQGKNFKFAMDKKKSGNPYPDVVEYSGNLWHCINPIFLEDQFKLQLERLKQNNAGGYIDVYLLHNPEYFFGWAKNNNEYIAEENVQKEFYSRIKKAFVFLEEKVRSGIIKYYGISSNTFPVNSKIYDFVSLEKIIQIANEISPENHFNYVQLPFNLLESGAMLEKNQRKNFASVLDITRKNNIFVLVNRPLNSITPKGLIRLADFSVEDYSVSDFQNQLSLTIDLENDLINRELEQFNIEENSRTKLNAILQIANLIKENWNNFTSIEHLNDVIENYFIPRINYLTDLFHSGQFDSDTEDYFDNYMFELKKLIRILTNIYKIKANKRNNSIKSIVDSHLKKDLHGLTLSQKAVHILRSVEGVGCVLVGAKKQNYVEEMINIMKVNRVTNPLKIFKKLQKDIFK